MPEILERRAVISGAGQSDVGRRLYRDPLELTLDACLAAIADAGLTVADIDGLSTYPGGMGGPLGFSGGGIVDVHDALRLNLNWYSGGLERPGARDCDAIVIGVDWGVQVLAGLAEPADATLRIETEAGTATVGAGARQVGVRVDRFELFRAMTGRRSLDQIRAFGWEGEPAPELLVFPIFTPRPTPLVE